MTDVLVAGAGIVGLAIGIGLARHGVGVVLAGPRSPRLDGRTVALLNGSIAFLDAVGLRPSLSGLAEPLRVMRIVDDTGSLFRTPPVTFRAEEIGEPWFGCNIENDDLVGIMEAAAAKEPRLTRLDRAIVGYDYANDVVLAWTDGGPGIRATVVAAADGRRSPARQAAAMTVKTWRYPQTALTAVLSHDRPHAGTSTEFHTREGPFTLVPLPRRAGDPHRSSLVWVMDPDRADRLSRSAPAALARDIERQSHRTLGQVFLRGEVGSFPIAGMVADRMVAHRIALAGEAAHVMPPIGAQGLNLGLRDARDLVEALSNASSRGADLGSAPVLDLYANRRHGDVVLRTMGVDRLNRSLLTGLLPVDAVRGAGLMALAHVGPLRRFAMRIGLGFSA